MKTNLKKGDRVKYTGKWVEYMLGKKGVVKSFDPVSGWVMVLYDGDKEPKKSAEINLTRLR